MNDADIIELFLAYHLEQGVDHVVLIDVASDDDTVERIRSGPWSAQVTLLDVDGEQHRERSDRRNRMLAFCNERLGADWVISSDVDEFWWAGGRRLVPVVQSGRAGVVALRCQRFNMVPVLLPICAEGDIVDLDRFRFAVRKPYSLTPDDRRDDRLPVPWIFTSVGPKTLARPVAGLSFTNGAHEVAMPGPAEVEWSGEICVLHLPIRSYPQFVDKVERCRTFVAANRLERGDAWHWQRWLKIQDRGGLEAEYRHNHLSPPTLPYGLADDCLSDETDFVDVLRSVAAST